MSKPSPDKWLGAEWHFNPLIKKISEIEMEYSREVVFFRNDVTRKQTQQEFFERVSEYFGFKIEWPKPEVSTPEGKPK